MPNIRMLSARRELYEKEKMKQQGIVKAKRNQENDSQDVAKKTSTSESARTAKKAERDARLASAEEKIATKKKETAAIGMAIGGIGAAIALGLTIVRLSTLSGDDKKKPGKGGNGGDGGDGDPKTKSKKDKDKDTKKYDAKNDAIAKLFQQILALGFNIQTSDAAKSDDANNKGIRNTAGKAGEGIKAYKEDKKKGISDDTQKKGFIEKIKDKQKNQKEIKEFKEKHKDKKYDDLSKEEKYEAERLGIKEGKDGKIDTKDAEKKNELTRDEKNFLKDNNLLKSPSGEASFDNIDEDKLNGELETANKNIEDAGGSEYQKFLDANQKKGKNVDTSKIDNAIKAVDEDIANLENDKKLLKKANDPNETLTDEDKARLKEMGVKFDENGNVDRKNGNLNSKIDENDKKLSTAKDSKKDLEQFRKEFIKEQEKSYGGLFRGGKNKFLMTIMGADENDAKKLAQPNVEKKLKKFMKEKGIDKDENQSSYLNSAIDGSLAKINAQRALSNLGLSKDQIDKYFKVDKDGNITLKAGLKGTFNGDSKLANDIKDGKLGDAKDVAKLLDKMNANGMSALAGSVLGDLKDRTVFQKMFGTDKEKNFEVTTQDILDAENDPEKEYSQNVKDVMDGKGNIDIDKLNALRTTDPVKYDKILKELNIDNATLEATFNNKVGKVDEGLLNKVLTDGKFDKKKYDALTPDEKALLDKVMVDDPSKTTKVFDQAKFNALPASEQLKISKSDFVKNNTDANGNIDQKKFEQLSADDKKLFLKAFVTNKDGEFDQNKFNELVKTDPSKAKEIMDLVGMKDLSKGDVLDDTKTKAFKDTKVLSNEDKKFIEDLKKNGVIKEDGTIDKAKFDALQGPEKEKLATIAGLDKNETDVSKIGSSLKKVVDKTNMSKEDNDLVNSVINADGSFNKKAFDNLSTNDQNKVKELMGLDTGEDAKFINNINESNAIKKEINQLKDPKTGKIDIDKLNSLRQTDPVLYDKVLKSLGLNDKTVEAQFSNKVKDPYFLKKLDPKTQELINSVKNSDGSLDVTKFNQLTSEQKKEVMKAIGVEDLKKQGTSDDLSKKGAFNSSGLNISRKDEKFLQEFDAQEGTFKEKFDKLDPKDKERLLGLTGAKVKDINNIDPSEIESIKTSFNSTMKNVNLDDDDKDLMRSVTNPDGSFNQTKFNEIMAKDPEKANKILGLSGLGGDEKTLNIAGENNTKILDNQEVDQMLTASGVDLKTSRKIIDSSNRYAKDELNDKIGGAKEHNGEKANWFNMMVLGLNASMPAIQFMLQQLEKMREAEDQLNEARKKKQAALNLLAEVAKDLKRTQSAINDGASAGKLG